MGNYSSRFEKILKENKITRETVIGSELMNSLLGDLEATTTKLSKRKAQTFLILLFEELSIEPNQEEIEEILTVCMKNQEGKFCIKHFRILITQFLPLSRLTSSLQVSLGDFGSLESTRAPFICEIANSKEVVLFRTRNGEVWSYGQDWEGNKLEEVPLLTRIVIATPIIQISCGKLFGAMLDYYGVVWIIGKSELPYSFGFDFSSPIGGIVSGPKIPIITQIACNTDSVYSVGIDGSLWCDKEKLSEIENVRRIGCGCNIVIVICKDTVWYKGDNRMCVKVPKFTKTDLIPNFDSIVDVACGEYHSLFLDDKGDVYASGANEFGQLGIEESISGNYLNSWIKIPNLPPIRKIYCQNYHSLCIDHMNNVWSFGINQYGQLATELKLTKSNIPARSSYFPPIITLSKGFGNCSIGIDECNTIWTCGRVSIQQKSETVIKLPKQIIESHAPPLRFSNVLSEIDHCKQQYDAVERNFSEFLISRGIKLRSIIRFEILEDMINFFPNLSENESWSRETASKALFVILNEIGFLLSKEEITELITNDVVKFCEFQNILKQTIPRDFLDIDMLLKVYGEKWVPPSHTESLISLCGDNIFVRSEYGEVYCIDARDKLVTNFTLSKVEIHNIRSIHSAGFEYTYLLSTNGEVWLIDNSYSNQTKGSKPILLLLPKIVSISTGSYHVCFLTEEGTVWGSALINKHTREPAGGFSVTLIPANAPELISGIENVCKVFCGYSITFFLCENGAIWTCGGKDADKFRGHLPTLPITKLVNKSNVMNIITSNGILFVMANGSVNYFANDKKTYHFTKVAPIRPDLIWPFYCYSYLYIGAESRLYLTDIEESTKPIKVNIPAVTMLGSDSNTNFLHLAEDSLWIYGQKWGCSWYNPVKLPKKFDNICGFSKSRQKSALK